MIDLVDELILRDEIQTACKLLDSVSCEKKSAEWGLVQSYKFFLADSKNKKTEILSSLKESAFCEYVKNLEVFIK